MQMTKYRTCLLCNKEIRPSDEFTAQNNRSSGWSFIHRACQEYVILEQHRVVLYAILEIAAKTRR